MDKILNLFAFLPFSIVISCLISIRCISTINAQEFEFNPQNYYSIEDYQSAADGESISTSEAESFATLEEESTSSDDTSDQDSEDSEKENCINNQIQSVLHSNAADDMKTDSYYSNFHFINKFNKKGTLVDIWGNVGSNDGEFLHAHGITIDSEDNIYVSDAENCNIQKFDNNGTFITMWGKKVKVKVNFCNPKVWQ